VADAPLAEARRAREQHHLVPLPGRAAIVCMGPVDDRFPDPCRCGGTAAPALLAALADMCSNLPAVLALLPLAVPAGAGTVLAVPPGSASAGSHLHRIVGRNAVAPGLAAARAGAGSGESTRPGLVATPVGLVITVLALRARPRLSGR
jgi:hypothetical protein